MGKYDDIINLEHPSPKRHPRMSAIERAAQFSAFAALSGYEDIIHETGRRTDSRPELDEEQIDRLNNEINKLQERLALKPGVKGSRFVPDKYKEGGCLLPFEGRLRNIDLARSELILTDGTAIPLRDICTLACENAADENSQSA